MFKDSHITTLTPWQTTEESSGLPAVNYPAVIGTGLLGLGLDVTGLQGLPDKLTAFFGSKHAPFHATQADLYVIHEGMISQHLWQSEVKHTGKDAPPGDFIYGQKRNFMPMGYLTQAFEYGGRKYEGDTIFAVGGQWKRTWNLRQAIVANRFALDRNIAVETEIFAPHGGETVYIKLTRRATRRVDVHGGNVLKGAEPFRWSIRLPLETRHGLKLFDQPGAVKPGNRTILATIDKDSRYKPSEAYTILYGIGAKGMTVQTSPEGWTASMEGPLFEEQVAWLRLDFCRFVGGDANAVAQRRQALEAELPNFSADAWEQARARHVTEYENFWANTADVELEQPDDLDQQRRLVLHISEYLFHCANDFSFGGTAQFLLFHQNGWGASNFHDHHYIVDGVARANLWSAAEANAWWMKRVMRPAGRAFPWMMTYDGEATTTPERDRAPMSDANRALLAMRIYELAGRGRQEMLRNAVFPIVKRVADMALDDWFYEQGGRMLFRGVETDVMGQPAIVNDTATVMMFLTLIRKAIEYSQTLGIHDPREPDWRRVLDAAKQEIVDGRYSPHLNAPPDAAAACWLCNIYYLAEAQPFMDDAAYAGTCDYSHRTVTCNLPWIGFAAASSEMRLGRPDRAEQHFVDIFADGVHGLGYFEEVAPVGSYGLPPLASAHGSHLVAACEQIVMSDFWRHRIFIGKGMPAKMRMGSVRFSSLRVRDGLIASGESDPKRLALRLHHTGDPVEMEIIIRVPCEARTTFTVRQDGRDLPHEFHGETVAVKVKLEYDMRTELAIEG